jgi:hypothetical protein
LIVENTSRSVHTTIYEFLDFLFSRFTAVETVYRRESIKLWEGLVNEMPQQINPKQLIVSKYAPE